MYVNSQDENFLLDGKPVVVKYKRPVVSRMTQEVYNISETDQRRTNESLDGGLPSSTHYLVFVFP